MRRVPRISETEWKVMRAVWAQDRPTTASEIIARLKKTDLIWHPKTVRTLLARLVDKKVLRIAEYGRTYVYEPRFSEQECIAAASGSFLERVFGGSLRPMLVHFIEERRLTREDLDELRELFDDTPGASGTKSSRRKGSK